MKANIDEYIVHDDLKKLITSSGLTVKTVALKLLLTPSTLSGKLNGYSVVSDKMKEEIELVCKEHKKMQHEEMIKRIRERNSIV